MVVPVRQKVIRSAKDGHPGLPGLAAGIYAPSRPLRFRAGPLILAAAWRPSTDAHWQKGASS